MCGISGEARFDGAAPDAAAVTRMTAAMRSRGPDGEGTWSDGWITLGHRRLTVIDLSEAGAQPMVRDDLGLALVFNGCVYNYPELRDELRAAGHTFRSTSDTEVILVAYAQWGSGSSTTWSACSRSRWWTGGAAASCWPATGSASSRSTSPSRPAGSGSPPRCRRCWRR